MADQDFLSLLVSQATISRKADVATDPDADEGMGPSNQTGNYLPVMVPVMTMVDGESVPLVVDGVPQTQQLVVACRVAQQSLRIRFASKTENKDADVSTLYIFTDYRTDIQERDRFIVDGVTYDTGTFNDPGLMHHHLEFVAKRIT